MNENTMTETECVLFFGMRDRMVLREGYKTKILWRQGGGGGGVVSFVGGIRDNMNYKGGTRGGNNAHSLLQASTWRERRRMSEK